VAKKLEKANIIVDSGVRLGVCETTRRGMRKAEMLKIVEFIERAFKNRESPNHVKRDVIGFMKDFQEVHFCFK
jgi:glycine hydroxymethyltransferase